MLKVPLMSARLPTRRHERRKSAPEPTMAHGTRSLLAALQNGGAWAKPVTMATRVSRGRAAVIAEARS